MSFLLNSWSIVLVFAHFFVPFRMHPFILYVVGTRVLHGLFYSHVIFVFLPCYGDLFLCMRRYPGQKGLFLYVCLESILKFWLILCVFADFYCKWRGGVGWDYIFCVFF